MEKILRSISEIMVPAGGPFPVGAAELGIKDRIERLVRGLGYPIWPIRLFLYIFNCAPLIFLHSVLPFNRLSFDSRRRFISRLEKSRFLVSSALFLALKALIIPIFYTTPEAGKAIGYPGDGDPDAA